MNRRNFLKTISVGVGATAVFTLVPSVITSPAPKISWEDFDWMPFPSCWFFKIEPHKGNYKFPSVIVTAKICKTKILYYENGPDLTRERRIIQGTDFTRSGYKVNMPKTIYTNEILLLEAKRLGFTHIYMFHSPLTMIEPDRASRRGYYISGASFPGWTTDHGKIQVVNV